MFFINNRVSNIQEVAGMVNRLVPDARVAIGHGQMEGKKLEKVMLDFMDGKYDVLVATSIIESGLDVPTRTRSLSTMPTTLECLIFTRCAVVWAVPTRRRFVS